MNGQHVAKLLLSNFSLITFWRSNCLIAIHWFVGKDLVCSANLKLLFYRRHWLPIISQTFINRSSINTLMRKRYEHDVKAHGITRAQFETRNGRLRKPRRIVTRRQPFTGFTTEVHSHHGSNKVCLNSTNWQTPKCVVVWWFIKQISNVSNNNSINRMKQFFNCESFESFESFDPSPIHFQKRT